MATKYHFDGGVEKTERLHKKGTVDRVVKEEYVYDNEGRAKELKHWIRVGTASPHRDPGEQYLQ